MNQLMRIVERWGILLLLTTLVVRPAAAQINFGAYATSNILLTVSGDLNFNDKQPAIASNSNQTVTISLTDNETQYIEIVGDATQDITVTVSSPLYLTTGGGGPGNQIPFALRFAYSNLGSADPATAKTNAIQVPLGFTSVTFPMLRRASGAPLPPPTPTHGGYTAPTATDYLFVYGSLGPVGNVTPANDYSATVNVHVSYTTY